MVYFDGEGHLQFARPECGDSFVFGGDVFDKGDGDIRICTELLRFKNAHPERVFLLVGNRDLNKLRLTAELAEDEIDVPQPVPTYPRAPPQVALRDFLEQCTRDGERAEGQEEAESKRPRRASGAEGANTLPNRLRWILDHTMTAKGAFEFRRRELARLRGVAEGEVDDDEVVRSFRDSVESEEGFVWQYLAQGQLLVLLGDTLFVHGGVPPGAAGMLPPAEMPYRTPPEGAECGFRPLPEGHSVRDWVEAMNDFYRGGLRDFRAQLRWRSDGSRSRGGEALLSLTSTPACFRRSVVVESMLQEGSPLPVDPDTEAYLASGGVLRVVTGHKPCGDSPFVVRSDVEFLMCDTTYSDHKAKDSRGAAAAAVEIELGSSESRVLLRGGLRDGAGYAFSLPSRGGLDQGADSLVSGLRENPPPFRGGLGPRT